MRRGRAGVGAAALLGLILAITPAAPVGAHAFLERADPRVGSTVHGSPDAVRLWFTERLEPAYSRFEVVDDKGRPVSIGQTQVDPADPRSLRALVPALPPGRYRVRWRVLSVDSHVTEGDFTFRVGP